MSRSTLLFRPVLAGLATAVLVTGLVTTPAGASAGPPGAAAATTPGAFIYVGNADDNQFSGTVDVYSTNGSSTSFPSGVDEDDAMAAGDLLDDNADEVVIADDDEHRIDVHDKDGKAVISFESRFNSEEDGLTVGNVSGDYRDEIIVADEALNQLIIYSPQTQAAPRVLSNTGFDSDDRVLTGDVDGGGFEEILVVNAGENGRIDAFNAAGKVVMTRFSAYDTGGDSVAAGYVTGDGLAEVVVGNDEDEGRVDVLNMAANTVDSFDTSYDGDDKIGVGDALGYGHAQVVVANTEDDGREIDVIDRITGDTAEVNSNYDSDDRFVVGARTGGDLDNDGIPDRVELNGIVDENGAVVLNLHGLGASPCRKDVLVETDYTSDGGHTHAPLEAAMLEAETLLNNPKVKGVADCPYPGADRSDGLRLIRTNRFSMDAITPEDAVVSLPTEWDAIKSHYFNRALDPYVHYNVWAHDFGFDPTGAAEKREGRASPGSDDQDFIVTLGSFQNPADIGVQAHAFVHELGHTLGLQHGGGDRIRCKPNYLSIMNYAFPTGLLTAASSFRNGLSDGMLADLDESELHEQAGMNAPADLDLRTWWSHPDGNARSGDVRGPIDWSSGNNDGVGGADDDVLGRNLTAERTLPDGRKLSCFGTPATDPIEKLRGFDDFAHLNESLEPMHDLGNDDDAGTDVTAAEHEGVSAYWDQELFPDRTVQAQPQQPGLHGSVLGVTSDDRFVYATHQYRTTGNPSTTDGPGSLVVLDRRTMQLVQRVEVGAGPRAVAVNPVTKRIYVANSGAGDYSVSVLDGTTRALIAKIPMGQNPGDLVVNARLNRVYVANSFQNTIQVIDGATSTLRDPIPVGPGLQGITIAEESNTLYLALSRRGGTGPDITALGAVVDDGVTKPRVLTPTPIAGSGTQPIDVAVDPVRHRIYVAGLGGGGVSPSVLVFDQASRAELKRITVANPLRSITANPRAGVVLAAGDGGVELIGGLDPVVQRHIPAGIAWAVSTTDGPGRQFYTGDFVSGQVRRLSYSS